MSGRLSAILDNLERVSQDPACPLEEMQLLVKEADKCHHFIIPVLILHS